MPKLKRRQQQHTSCDKPFQTFPLNSYCKQQELGVQAMERGERTLRWEGLGMRLCTMPTYRVYQLYDWKQSASISNYLSQFTQLHYW